MIEAEKRIRAAVGVLDPAVLEAARKELDSAFIDCTLHAQVAIHVARYLRSCSLENIAALLAEIDRLQRTVSELRMAEAEAMSVVLDGEGRIARLTRERDEARAERDALRAACKTTLMLRQLGGMMPGTKAVIDVAIHHAEEALAQIEREKANGSR